MKNTKLEEAAEKYFPYHGYKDHDAIQKMNRGNFIAGANYQAKQDEELAIEFAEWMNEQIYKYSEDAMWRSKSRCIAQFPDYTTYIIINEKGDNILPKGTFLTIKELFQLFLKSKEK